LASLIISSILRIVMAASVANFKLFTFDIDGSMTPFVMLFLTLPFISSRPLNFNAFFFSSSPVFAFWAALWKTLNLARRSVASLAALIASTFGIIYKASENSAIANCSLEPKVRAKLSK